MLRAIALLSIGLTAFSTAHAADNGVYLGLGISQSKIDTDLRSGSSVVRIDGDDTKFKVIAGIRPLDWLAFEVNYVDFGSIDSGAGATRSEYKLKGLDGFVVGLFEVGLVDFYGKAGVVRWDQEASIANVNVPAFDDDGFDPAFGAGIQFHFGSIGVRAEYEKFDLGDTDADLITLGLTWTFL